MHSGRIWSAHLCVQGGAVIVRRHCRLLDEPVTNSPLVHRPASGPHPAGPAIRSQSAKRRGHRGRFQISAGAGPQGPCCRAGPGASSLFCSAGPAVASVHANAPHRACRRAPAPAAYTGRQTTVMAQPPAPAGDDVPQGHRGVRAAGPPPAPKAMRGLVPPLWRRACLEERTITCPATHCHRRRRAGPNERTITRPAMHRRHRPLRSHVMTAAVAATIKGGAPVGRRLRSADKWLPPRAT